ncbi:MAG: antitoxin Xre-like helix-turn-helix domain-containing protein [Thermoanaerobaculia bacterium]
MRTSSAPADVEKFRRFLKTGMPGEHAYVVLLGLSGFDYPSIIEQIEKGLPYSAFDRFQRNTGFTSDQLGEFVQVPRRTLARRKADGRFSADESDRLVRAARVYGKALHFFGGDPVETTAWLTSVRRALGGVTPLDLARTGIGAQEVENLIGRLEHGVFS